MGMKVVNKYNDINNKEIEDIFSYIGTEYMAEIIYILYHLDRNYNCDFQNEIYPLLACKYETSINNIRSAVAFATEKMFFDCTEEYLKKYINDYKFKKPGPKKIAFSVIKKINNNT